MLTIVCLFSWVMDLEVPGVSPASVLRIITGKRKDDKRCKSRLNARQIPYQMYSNSGPVMLTC